jgi:hypothetical protein
MQPAEGRGVALAVQPWYLAPDTNDQWTTAGIDHDTDTDTDTDHDNADVH